MNIYRNIYNLIKSQVFYFHSNFVVLQIGMLLSRLSDHLEEKHKDTDVTSAPTKWPSQMTQNQSQWSTRLIHDTTTSEKPFYYLAFKFE